MTNSKKKTFVFLTIAFALLISLTLLMANDSTKIVRAETISSNQYTLFNDGINSDDRTPYEVEKYEMESGIANTITEDTYTIQITREQYIEKILYNNEDVSEILVDGSSPIAIIVSPQRPFEIEDIVIYLEQGEAQIMTSLNVCMISEIKKDLKIYVGIKDVISNISYYIDGQPYYENPTQYSNKLKTILPKPMIEEKGKEFNGWYTDKECNGNRIESIEIGEKGDKILYGTLIDAKYTVHLKSEYISQNDKDVNDLIYGKRYVLPVPERIGYNFDGWYSEEGIRYTYANGICVKEWSDTEDITLYDHWTPQAFSLYLNTNGGDELNTKLQTVYWDSNYTLPIPTRQGYTFIGWYFSNTSDSDTYKLTNEKGESLEVWHLLSIPMLYAHWKENTYNVYLTKKHSQEEYSMYYAIRSDYDIKYSANQTCDWAEEYMIYNGDKRLFTEWQVILGSYYDYNEDTNPWRSYSSSLILTYSVQDIMTKFYPDMTTKEYITIRAYYDTPESSSGGGSCISEGSLITLADGTQKPVEQLKGDEQLLVWNMFTGEFDTAPILFIDHDATQVYEVINLYFSDNTTLKVMTEHAFWDVNLNKYVYLRKDANIYIGHWFNKQIMDEKGNFVWTAVQLTDVAIREEYTSAWSPVTYGFMGYYVNGMLSIPGNGESFINYFDVDAETMQYDILAMQKDVAKYGLFTYDEFANLVPITEEIFNAFNGQYLKIAIGKGITTIERINELVELYWKYL